MDYVTPENEQASMHNILGAYPLAGFFGYSTIEYLLPHPDFGHSLDYAIAGGFAVGITILAMLLAGFKHAPAAGAALAFVLKPANVGAVVFSDWRGHNPAGFSENPDIHDKRGLRARL